MSMCDTGTYGVADYFAKCKEEHSVSRYIGNEYIGNNDIGVIPAVPPPVLLGPKHFRVGTFLYNVVPELVGLENQSNEACGKINKVGCCGTLDLDHIHTPHYWCDTASCKVCFKYGWINRTVARLKGRVTILQVIAQRIKHKIGGLNNGFLSYPKDMWEPLYLELGAEKCQDKLIKVGVKALTKAGAKGVLPLIHWYRVKKDCKVQFHTLQEAGVIPYVIMDRDSKGNETVRALGIYDWVRMQHLENDWLELSPHLHFYYFGYLQDSKVFHCNSAGFKCKMDRCPLQTGGKCPYFADKKDRKCKTKGKGMVYKKKHNDMTMDHFERNLRYVLTHTSVLVGYNEHNERGVLRKKIISDGFGVFQWLCTEKPRKEKVQAECHCGKPLFHCYNWSQTQLSTGEWVVQADPDYFRVTDIPFLITEKVAKYWFKGKPNIYVYLINDRYKG